jgi:hypothetical protein
MYEKEKVNNKSGSCHQTFKNIISMIDLVVQMAARALNSSQYSEPCTSLSPLCQDQPSMPIQVKT